jgi:hypothetical protein
MISNKKNLELFNYINKPMTKESILVLYAAHNIKYEKCELYSDFVISLIDLVFTTYLGDDLTSLSDQKNHFKWCWNKNVENYKLEGVYVESQKLYKYFHDFMFQVFYTVPKSVDTKPNENIIKLWKYILDYNNNKSKSDIDTLIEVYKLFEAGTRFK